MVFRSRVVPLLLLAFACAPEPERQPNVAFSGPWMTPNEKHHAVEPCRDKVFGPARLLMRVSVDAQGQPLASDVTLIGGSVTSILMDCIRQRSLEQRYQPVQGKAGVVGTFVDLVPAANTPNML